MTKTKDEVLKALWEMAQSIIKQTNFELKDLGISTKSIARHVAFQIAINFPELIAKEVVEE